MNEQRETVGGFEERLLTELRRVVEGGPAPAAAPPVSPERRSLLRRPLTAAGGVAAAAAATLAAVFAIGGGGDSDAWAVTSNDDGTVTVEINALSDADGLERKLHAAGVPAVVEYERAGEVCATAQSAGTPVSPNAEDVVPEAPNAKGMVTEPPNAKGGVTPERGLNEAPAGASEYGLDQAGRPPTDTSGGSPKPPDGNVMGMRTNGDGGVEFTLSKDVPRDTSFVITRHTPELRRVLEDLRRVREAAGPRVDGAAISVLYAAGDIQRCEFDARR